MMVNLVRKFDVKRDMRKENCDTIRCKLKIKRVEILFRFRFPLNTKIEYSWKGELLKNQRHLFLKNNVKKKRKKNLKNNYISLFIYDIFVPTEYASLNGLTNHCVI